MSTRIGVGVRVGVGVELYSSFCVIEFVNF